MRVSTVLRVATVTIVAAAATILPAAPSSAAAPSYGSFRLVKAVAGAPSQPQIVLPEGYSFVPGSQFQVASRLEYYSFIQGPRSEAVPVTVRWPGEHVATAVSLKTRPAIQRDEADGSITFTVPVTGSSTGSVRNTLEIFSYLHRVPGTYFRHEHNDPDRAAGFYATVPWVGNQSRAVYNQLFAAEAVLIDSGLAAEARARGDFWALMGFETNNVLHPDNPPAWHFSYVVGGNFGARGTTVPHIWLDDRGRNFFNGMNVAGSGRTNYDPGQPAPIRRPDGSLAATLTVRTDGGVDIDPGQGRPVYSILSVAPRQELVTTVEVRRGGLPWRRFEVYDDVKDGAVWVHRLEVPERRWTHTRYRYDHELGTVRDIVVVREFLAPAIP